MSTSGEAADQVVRIGLDGVQTALHISGEGAIGLTRLLFSELSRRKKDIGYQSFENEVMKNRPMEIFTIDESHVLDFCSEAKRYGLNYHILKDKDSNNFNVLVDATDAPKVNRILSYIYHNKDKDEKANNEFKDYIFSDKNPQSSWRETFPRSRSYSEKDTVSREKMSNIKSVRDLLDVLKFNESVVNRDGSVERKRKIKERNR